MNNPHIGNFTNNPNYRAVDAFVSALGLDINDLEELAITPDRILVAHHTKRSASGSWPRSSEVTETRRTEIRYKYDEEAA